jgi:hypothetical protein
VRCRSISTTARCCQCTSSLGVRTCATLCLLLLLLLLWLWL